MSVIYNSQRIPTLTNQAIKPTILSINERILKIDKDQDEQAILLKD